MAFEAIRTTRDVISLDGIWEFRHETDAVWRDAEVPMPWQALFADLRNCSGRATYRRRFDLPDRRGREAVLHFGAVDYLAEVRLNGQLIGQHEGGYLPFECLIPEDLLIASNEVEVLCDLPDTETGFGEMPHGKQSWYGPIGGIWQSVTLELRDAGHLDHCQITADLPGRSVASTLTLPEAAKGADLTVAVLGPDGHQLTSDQRVASGTKEDFRFTLDSVQPWSPDHPALYTLQVSVGRDVSRHSFGFRSIATEGGRILLNGKPFFMRAALDQDYYPEGICTPPSLEFLEDQLRKAKHLGLNMLRCHIKVPDPRYYEVADRLGMLIWTEVPNVGHFTATSAHRMRQTMEGILARDGNHPSIVIWTLINEDWGTRLCEDPAHRAWLKAEYDWLKAADPTRLVVDNSPCNGNFHVKTDLNDFHYYRSVPERRSEWDALTAEFANGADWPWSPFGDAVRRGDEPLLVSEFGVWGLPNPAQVALDGAEPWWMETGGTWGDGAAYPHGIQTRFASLQLDKVFGSFEGFIAAAQWYQFANLKYEIEEMRAWPSIMGYVITEFTDVHWESNGLLDMNRNPRAFHDQFSTINADIVIVPRIGHHAGWAGDEFSFELQVATGGQSLPAAELHWSTEGQNGVQSVPATGPVATASAGKVTLVLPQGDSRMLRIDLTLQVAGRQVARNAVEIAVYAKRRTVQRTKVATSDAGMTAFAKGLGYLVVSKAKADVILTRALSATDIAAMQAGRRYVVFADGTAKTQRNLRVEKAGREQPFIKIVDNTPGLPRGAESLLPNISLVPRTGTMWRGDWIAGFSWIRRSGPLAALPGGPLVDLSFDRVIPHHVLLGFRPADFGGPVRSGTVVGWAHKPAAFIAERRVGKGALVASTFRLFGDTAGTDPVAATLFDALIEIATAMPTET
ncbi:MAG: glycoside hydrolase family 2 TIM barrel-domain containing protein [bacterium]